MAEDQKLKPNPDGLDFDDAVGNTGHSNTHITYQQNNCLFFFFNAMCHLQHLLATLDLQEKYPSVLWI